MAERARRVVHVIRRKDQRRGFRLNAAKEILELGTVRLGEPGELQLADEEDGARGKAADDVAAGAKACQRRFQLRSWIAGSVGREKEARPVGLALPAAAERRAIVPEPQPLRVLPEVCCSRLQRKREQRKKKNQDAPLLPAATAC